MGLRPHACTSVIPGLASPGVRPRSKRGKFVNERHQRLRREVCDRQRLGVRERQRHLRQDAVPHGHPGEPEEHLPLQHPGPAHLVRGQGVGGGLSRPARRHRPDGRHEPAVLQGGPGRGRAGRLAALRFDAVAGVAARRHQGAGRAHRADVRGEMERSAPAPAVQEHGLRRRADRAARHGRRGAERRHRRPAQGQGEADRRQHGGGGAGPQLRNPALRLPAADPRAARAGRQGQDPDLRQRRRGARGNLCRRHGLCLVSHHAVDLAGRGLREVRPPPARHQGRPAALRHRAGRGRAGRHRRGHRRRLERRACRSPRPPVPASR